MSFHQQTGQRGRFVEDGGESTMPYRHISSAVTFHVIFASSSYPYLLLFSCNSDPDEVGAAAIFSQQADSLKTTAAPTPRAPISLPTLDLELTDDDLAGIAIE
jgi:hypothetical protein